MMMQALAPRSPRGCSWVWLSLVLAALVGSDATTRAQEPPKKDAAKKDAAKKDAAKKDAAKAEPSPPVDEPIAETKQGVEVFKDPRAEQALTIFKSTRYKDATRDVIVAVREMAAGNNRPDTQVIQQYVEGMAYRLADKSNINGLLNPTGRASRAIPQASEMLLDPLNTARLAKNQPFIDAYSNELNNTLPKLLDHNLVTRTEAAIALGQAGSAKSLPTFLSIIKDPNQTVQVKIWAMRGVANCVGNGTDTAKISAAEAIAAGKVIADFLVREKDTLWFLQVRALEALGSLRQASAPPNIAKAEIANVAMSFLADEEARPEVRAAAAWALGMMQVNPSVQKYNFILAAFDTGRLAAELGEQVNVTLKPNPTRANYLTGLLVGPVHQSFQGVDGVRESGLQHSPSIGASRTVVSKIGDLSSSVARASVELVRAVGTQVKDKQKELGDRVAALKDYLGKNAPKDFQLVPGGPQFLIKQAQVADRPEAKGKLAGAPGEQ
jgi:hypothetical protein